MEVLALLRELASPADGGRHTAHHALASLRAIGPDALPALRQVRRSASPLRRQALVASAEIGGWEALDRDDQQIIQRMISVEITREVPAPMSVCGTWYALHTSDQAAVLTALDLVGAVPVPMRLGELAWHNLHHGYPPIDRPVVYVTPALDGWTLAFGDFAHLQTWPDVGEEMAGLSRRFRAAHCYHVIEGFTGWCIAEYGRIVRSYCNELASEQIGPPHPAESGFVLPHTESYPEGDAARRFEGLARAFANLYFRGRESTIRDPAHPFHGLDREALPRAFRAEVNRFTTLFGVGRPGGWYPDDVFEDLARFTQVSQALAAAAVETGLLDRYLWEENTPRCSATDVAAGASVDPTRLGRRVRVTGHGVLAWPAAAAEGAGSPLNGLRGLLAG